MALGAWAGQAKAKSPELSLGFSYEWLESKYLGHLLLLSRVYWQGTVLLVEQLEFKAELKWDTEQWYPIFLAPKCVVSSVSILDTLLKITYL